MVCARPRGLRRSGYASTNVILFVMALAAGLFLGATLWAPEEPAAPATPTAGGTLPRPSAANPQLSAASAANPATAPTHEELSQQIVALKDRLALIEEDSAPTANLRKAVGSDTPPRQKIRLPAPTDSSAARKRQRTDSGERSLAYWHGLNKIMLTEEQMRKPPVGGLTASNAAQFLQTRGEAGDFAAAAIRQLPVGGVDREVVALATDIAAWYEQGTNLNDMGSFLLNKADANAGAVHQGAQWSDAEQAHSQSVGELNRRGDQLRLQMIQKYRLDFPDLR